MTARAGHESDSKDFRPVLLLCAPRVLKQNMQFHISTARVCRVGLKVGPAIAEHQLHKFAVLTERYASG